MQFLQTSSGFPSMCSLVRAYLYGYGKGSRCKLANTNVTCVMLRPKIRMKLIAHKNTQMETKHMGQKCSYIIFTNQYITKAPIL